MPRTMIAAAMVTVSEEDLEVEEDQEGEEATPDQALQVEVATEDLEAAPTFTEVQVGDQEVEEGLLVQWAHEADILAPVRR